MKKIKFLGTLLIAATMFSGCDPNDNPGASGNIIIDNSELTQQVYADQTTATGGVSFTTKGAWTSTITEKPATAKSPQRRANSATADAPLWIAIDPDHGDAADDYTINIVLEANTTGADRTAIITIRCGETEISITVTQRATTETGEQPETPRLITQIASSAVINSDFFENREAGYVNPNLLYEFTYDNSHKLKEIILSADNEQQVVTYNYDIAGEVRISGDGTTIRGILNSNGTVKTIKWQREYSDEQYTSNLAYNAEGYLSDYDDNSSYSEDCNAYRYQWNSGNLAAVTHKNCTTQVYRDYLGLEYSDKLNDKTNLDLNALCFDICSNYTLNDKEYIYQYPSMFFALSGNTGKRSKNYLLKINDLRDLADAHIESPNLPYSEATAPAIGSVLNTYYRRAFDGNAVWQFDGQDFPTKFSRTVKVTKTQVILDSYERETATPHDDNEREYWIREYGEGPWFFITNRQYHENNTVKNDIYTWAISYNK